MRIFNVRLLVAALLTSAFLLTACSSPSGSDDNKKVEDNGLTRDINDLVPDSLLMIIDSLGMPINRGANPPNIEDSFLCSPLILLNSNISGDWIGYQFADYYLRFYGQDNDELTVNIDYVNGDENGSGMGSFVVGENDEFSVFSRLTIFNLDLDSAYILLLVSGERQETSIANMHLALFMLDNFGNPSGHFINNGEGRVFHDSDSLSPQTAFPGTVMNKPFADQVLKSIGQR